MVKTTQFKRVLGHLKSLFFSKWLVLAVCIFYIFCMVSVITWGLPNKNHPFNYFMDEWHQLQSVRSVFKYGSNNVSGAAHGPMLHFILSGLYLGVLTLFKIVNPFVVHSSLTELLMQEKIFIALRITTIIFGLLTILVLYKIARIVKINPVLPITLYIVNPVFLYQSQYFKYDIALAFWVTLFIYMCLRFLENSGVKNYVLTGISLGLSVATKMSALPLIIPYILIYFFIHSKNKFHLTSIIYGFVSFLITLILLGFPDVLLQKGDYREFLYSNLIGTPQIYNNFVIHGNQWIYLLFTAWPFDLGYLFYSLSIVAIFYFTVLVFKLKREYSKEYFLLVSTIFLVVSMIPLRLGATGNRVVILLPFLALLSSLVLTKILYMSGVFKKFIIALTIILFLIQVHQSVVVVVSKWYADPRELSSVWIQQHIPHDTEIGIENIPIYQSLPDIVLKEFYNRENNPSYKSVYFYKIVDMSTVVLPKVIIVTDHLFENNYIKKSPKKSLIQRLAKEGYTIVAQFKAPRMLYASLENELNFYITGLVGTHSIAIYKK